MQLQQEIDELKSKLGIKETQCSCNDCANMCRRSPCVGTPTDMANLIANGYINRLTGILWGLGMTIGVPAFEMVIQDMVPGTKQCVFFKDGLCELHNLGLKPIEGKLAIHGGGTVSPSKHPTIVIGLTWRDPRNATTVGCVIRIMDKYLNRAPKKIEQRIFHLPAGNSNKK